ncbi:MAG: glycosyltransferase [Candidatus Peregrinibacteria bacterium]|nr:glycosyltransferase [Candidatus Peregrinibacteria bacterium]MDZ4245449.1 glycosyltransferase [Candidatus Gracilibacteria bacterium]
MKSREDEFFKVKKSRLGRLDESLPFGVNIIGYITAECGIGQISRGMIMALKQAGVAISVYNFDIGWHRNADNSVETFSDELPYSINLCCFNADETPRRLSEIGAEKLKGKYNIGLWAWELDSFPDEWKGAFEYVHEVWTISDFAKKSIQKATDLKVSKIPLLVEPIVDTKFNRTYFGISKDVYVFLFSFDGFSFADRKNPFATAAAYAAAFPSDSTMLIIKTQNLDRSHEKKLHVILKGTQYRIINEYYAQEEFTGLLNSIDCYVSLHRAEGFGYGLAEAMYLKKTVIGTNYSGNLDFMDDTNSFLVPYKLVEIEKTVGPYKKGNHWADVDIEDAVKMMKKVYEDRDENYMREKQELAHAQIIKLYSSVSVANALKKLLK